MPIRLACAALLGIAAALLASCGGSGKGLIPSASATPLQGDFETVAQAAQAGNGSCAATEAALDRTEKDFLALPATVDPALQKRLREGIDNLRKYALAACAQPVPTVTTATTTPTQTTPATTPTQTTTTSTTSTTTQAAPPSEQGGTPAPGEGEGAEHGEPGEDGRGHGGGHGGGESESGGVSAGGAGGGQ